MNQHFKLQSRLVGWLYWVLRQFNSQSHIMAVGDALCVFMAVGDALCVSWLSHTSANTTLLSKATDYFSHILLQR